MEKVNGIGGIFFRAKDPNKLAKWYLDNLGIALVPTDETGQPWVTEKGVTVFSPFKSDTDYFRAESQFMINFRVGDLAAMVAQLRANGIDVFNEQVMEGIGKFAHLHDPEGTPLELWEPADS